MLLVDVAYMTELHHRWMGGDGPTDVLAFPMDELAASTAARTSRGREPTLLGDVVLCPEVRGEAGRARPATRRPTSCSC